MVSDIGLVTIVFVVRGFQFALRFAVVSDFAPLPLYAASVSFNPL